jgi:hypothetical protein
LCFFNFKQALLHLADNFLLSIVLNKIIEALLGLFNQLKYLLVAVHKIGKMLRIVYFDFKAFGARKVRLLF